MICTLHIYQQLILGCGLWASEPDISLWASEVVAVGGCKLVLRKHLVAGKPSPVQGLLSTFRPPDAEKFQVYKTLHKGTPCFLCVLLADK